MPGMNGKGPLGEGPMTGRAMGKCGGGKIGAGKGRGKEIRKRINEHFWTGGIIPLDDNHSDNGKPNT
ncbi:MAG: DUF5320 domain-containing protein [Brevinematales bacterium]|nr:DUF5320 domain-containing protein [Brevinematales bacterium]